MKKTKIVLCIATFAVALGIGVNAGAFSDMPAGRMGEAMQNAVDAKLIEGIDSDTIAPYDNITRAQMATIITRAFGYTKESAVSYSDVNSEAWYSGYVAKATEIGAFQGDESNRFRPNDFITFQETYLVLSRVFGFEPYEVKKTKQMLGDCDASVLNNFPDKNELAPWAFNGAKYIVGNGGWKGIDGKLKPTAFITRGEFAILMDDLVAEYIDEPGTYAGMGDGLVMVRSGGVIIDDLKSNHNLIVSYGVDKGGLIVKNSIINGVTLVLGGADVSPVESQTDGVFRVLPDESYVKIGGQFYDVRVNSPFVYLDATDAKIQYYKGVKSSLISLNKTI